MPSYRILYVGSDCAPLQFLTNALQDCLIVRCPNDYQARLFLKSNIKYSLLLFEASRQGAELECFARSLEHREHTPVVNIKKSENFGALVIIIRRLLPLCRDGNCGKRLE